MRTQEEMRAEIISKAVDDDAFRALLLDDPKKAVQEALGVTVPDAFNIEVHEEGAMVAHLVLPASNELSAEDLAFIAGGGGVESYNGSPSIY